YSLPSEKSKHSLWSGVGLGQGGDAGLKQDLRLGEVGRFRRQVGVTDARFGGCQVAQLGLRQVNGIVELILTSADDCLRAAERTDRGSQDADRVKGSRLGGNVRRTAPGGN